MKNYEANVDCYEWQECELFDTYEEAEEFLRNNKSMGLYDADFAYIKILSTDAIIDIDVDYL